MLLKLRVTDPELLLDLTQDTIVKMLRSGKLEELKDEAALNRYLKLTARSIFMDHCDYMTYRRTESLEAYEAAHMNTAAPSMERQVIAKEAANLLHEHLTDEEWTVANMKAEGYSREEIATAVGIATPLQVANVHTRTKRKAKKLLAV